MTTKIKIENVSSPPEGDFTLKMATPPFLSPSFVFSGLALHLNAFPQCVLFYAWFLFAVTVILIMVSASSSFSFHGCIIFNRSFICHN